MDTLSTIVYTADMRIRTVHSRDHHARSEFRPYVEGQHAILLEDEHGTFQGELVWRLANIGQGLVEITGFGIEATLRRKGWGSQMLETALDDMQTHLRNGGITPRSVYLFANEQSDEAMGFYRARGFRPLGFMPGLFERGQAVVLARDLFPSVPSPVTLERLAQTDSPALGDPEASGTAYGPQVRRMGTTTLLADPCHPDGVDGLLAWVAPHDISRITGTDAATLHRLWPRLEVAGWSRGGLLMMVSQEPSAIATNPDVEIEVIDPARLAQSPSYRKLLADDGALDHWQMEVETAWRLGGEVLVGWLDGRPAGRCGWYVRDEVWSTLKASIKALQVGRHS